MFHQSMKFVFKNREKSPNSNKTIFTRERFKQTWLDGNRVGAQCVSCTCMKSPLRTHIFTWRARQPSLNTNRALSKHMQRSVFVLVTF